MTDLREDFKNHVTDCANTGKLIQLPEDLDCITCGAIMADVASSFLDGGQDIKAIIILNERQRLGV